MKHIYTSLIKNRAFLKGIKTTCLFVSFVFIGISSFSQVKEFGKSDCKNSNDTKIFSSKLLSFNAMLKGNAKVILNWTTTVQTNTSHFIMQRSVDGHKFHDAALLFTNEDDQDTKMEYYYADNISFVKDGPIYYRLKIVDAIGQSTYSAPVRVYLERTKEQMTLLTACPGVTYNEIACK